MKTICHHQDSLLSTNDMFWLRSKKNNFHIHTLVRYQIWPSGAVVIWLTLCQKVSSVTTFANSLDQDQARQIVGPDLDPNYLTL